MNPSEARKILTGDDPHKTYRLLARKHHPDAGGSAEEFNKIREAYETLTKEETTSEHELIAQLFLQELDLDKVSMCLSTMEATKLVELHNIAAKEARLVCARPKAKGFLVQVLESAILALEDERKPILHEISEVKKAKTLLNNLFTI